VISPAEVFMVALRGLVDSTTVPHVVVGPLSFLQQQAGGVSLMDSGEVRSETLPLVRPRLQVRCIAPTLGQCEVIGRTVELAIQTQSGRQIITQPSTGEQFLLHTMTVNGAPSAHRDTDSTWEYLLFAEAMMGTIPVAP
jgi:hypothetical protein